MTSLHCIFLAPFFVNDSRDTSSQCPAPFCPHFLIGVHSFLLITSIAKGIVLTAPTRNKASPVDFR